MIKSTKHMVVVVVTLSYPPLPLEPAWLVVVVTVNLTGHHKGVQDVVSQHFVRLAGPAGSPGNIMMDLLMLRLRGCTNLT